MKYILPKYVLPIWSFQLLTKNQNNIEKRVNCDISIESVSQYFCDMVF